ncbi:MAG: hypothetical protein IJP15_07660 [Oscillospiraceae bacterium]|nr:hypothetical protein [Oscillospiraceae bacterium]
MSKKLTKVLALALAAAMTLSACGSTQAPAETPAAPSTPEATTPATPAPSTPAAPEAEPITDLVIGRLATREIETFNILYSTTFSDFENLTNMIDSLVEVDTKGNVVPAIAESWETNDNGLTWTFHLREGVKWVDMNGNIKGDVTSHDWAVALEWVMNYHKNKTAHTSQPSDMIAGAADYLAYTKELSEADAWALDASEGSKFMEMVGIECPDELTLVYHCPTEKPYFPSFPAWAGLYPMPQGMVDELGVEGVMAMDNTNYWYNGCYTMTTFVHGNEKVFTKNPHYWDTEATLFDTVTVKMLDSNEVAYQLYENGEIDMCSLTESTLNTIYNNKDHKFYNYLVEQPATSYAYQFHINFYKNNEDGTEDVNYNKAIANTAFRQSIYYGLDLTTYLQRTNSIHPLSCENDAYTMKGLIYTTDGTDYTQLVRDELGLPAYNGETPVRLNADKAAALKAQAIEELTAIGVTFPVEFDYYISGSNQTALDTANVLAQAFKDCLGDDYIKLNICTYVSSFSQEVRNPRLFSISINGWGADYADPVNYLGQEILSESANYKTYNNMLTLEKNDYNADLFTAYETFTAMVEAADAIVDDHDARLQAFAEAEAYMIENVLTMPAYYGVSWGLTRVNYYSRMNAIFGCQNDKMKNWETNVNGYTTEEMAAAAAANA